AAAVAAAARPAAAVYDASGDADVVVLADESATAAARRASGGGDGWILDWAAVGKTARGLRPGAAATGGCLGPRERGRPRQGQEAGRQREQLAADRRNRLTDHALAPPRAGLVRQHHVVSEATGATVCSTSALTGRSRGARPRQYTICYGLI